MIIIDVIVLIGDGTKNIPNVYKPLHLSLFRSLNQGKLQSSYRFLIFFSIPLERVGKSIILDEELSVITTIRE